MANHWTANGWEVIVVTNVDAGDDFYQLLPGVKRISLGMAAPSKNQVHAILCNLRRTWALYRILMLTRPDYSIAMMPAANIILAIAGRLAGVPSIGSERTYPPAMPIGRFWEAARKRVYPLLPVMVAQTSGSAMWLHAHAPAKRIVVIPNPIKYPIPAQYPRVDPQSVHAKLEGERLLLAVGRLSEEKGFDRLVEAFAHLSSGHLDWSLIILGEGPQRDELEAQVTRLRLIGRVAFPGIVGNVGDWFEAADAYTITSKFEGFPNTLLEAMAYGLPPVAIDCTTGPREIVIDDVNGLLVPQDDQAALVVALDRMMRDSEVRARLATRAIEVRDTFSVHRIANEWEKIFLVLTEKSLRDTHSVDLWQ